MKPVFATEGLKALLSFPFRDPKAAQKILIGSLLSFAQFIIPIVPGIFVMGYLSQVLRRVTSGNGEASMPEWENWGELFMDGLKVTAAVFIYTLPLTFIFGLLYISMFAPMIAIPFMEDAGGEMTSMAMMIIILTQLFMFLMIAFMMVVYVVYAIVLPPMMAHTAARNQFGAAFQIGRWWKIFRSNFSGFVAALIIMIGIYTVFMYGIYILYMTLILCFLIPLLMAPLGFYISLVGFAALGEVYRIGEEKVNPPAVEQLPA